MWFVRDTSSHDRSDRIDNGDQFRHDEGNLPGGPNGCRAHRASVRRAGSARRHRHACRPVAAPALPLTRAADIHDLPATLAEKHLPVHLTGVVTYYDPAQSTLFVADSSGSAFVATTHPYPLHRGDLVEVDGKTKPSFRTVIGPDPVIRVLGQGSAESAKIPGLRSYQELNASKWDCQYVSVRGVVRSAVVENHGVEDLLELEIMMPGGMVQGYVHDFAGIDPQSLIDAEIVFSGVVGGEFNAQQQLMRSVLYATNAADIQIVRAPDVRPHSLPLTPIDRVMETRYTVNQSPRVRVRGIVTFYRPGHAVVIQNGNQSLYASTREANLMPLDTVVDLVGFATEGEYGPFLVQTHIIPTGEHAHIEATPVTYAQAISGEFSDNFVALRGTLVSQLHVEGSDTLSLMVDGHPVTAVLQEATDDPGLPKFPIGSTLEVRGVCRMVATDLWTAPGSAPLLFQINMRYPGDIKVIHSPSWWTVGHVLILLGLFAAVSLLITIWAIMLRRRVAEQTATLARTTRVEQERSRILHAVNSAVALDELLRDICRTFGSLSPGLCCGCSIEGLQDQREQGFEPIYCGDPPPLVLFEAPLGDPEGRQIGRFVAGRMGPSPLSDQEMELVTVASGLANVAVNQRRLYQELNYSSTHDQLTSLPNRRSADLSLDTALQRAVTAGTRVAVAYIDVDQFKQVNDQHGHKVGDLYLQQIAARLSAVVRSTDKLARIGGDEFLLVASGLHAKEDAEAYRTRLESCFANSFVLDGRRLCGSASIGISVYPDHGTTAEDLKRHADFDMYSAKHRRRSAATHDRSFDSVEPAIFSPADLRLALESNRFELFYQPQFSATGELRGLEALLRLNDPILGTVTPDAFIAVAEGNELMLPLGQWVLRQAITDAMAWNLPSLHKVRIVINVSVREIETPDYAQTVLDILRSANFPANRLELEITERMIMRNVTIAEQQLTELQEQGVRIAIDDFGTEYSCLSALHSLPVDTLKIDRSFLRALRAQPEVMHTIEAIVSLAHGMRKRVVVEGVETEKELAALLKLGDIDLQGFFFSRPQPAATITSRLPEWYNGSNGSDGLTSSQQSNPGPVH